VIKKCADFIENEFDKMPPTENGRKIEIELIKLMNTDVIKDTIIKPLYDSSLYTIMKKFRCATWNKYKLDQMFIITDYYNIPYQGIIHIIHTVPNDGYVFNFIISWILHDSDKRKIHMKDFLSQVLFDGMSPKYINLFLPECFKMYFPDEIPKLNMIREDNPIDLDYMADHNYMYGYNRIHQQYRTCRKIIMTAYTKNSLFNKRFCELAGAYQEHGFYC